MKTMPVHLVYEGQTDEVILLRLFQHLRLPNPILMNQGGKNRLLDKLPRYNHAARAYGHWVIVVDLDQEAASAQAYTETILTKPADRLILCVAVQAIESWILADQEHFAAFLGIPLNRVPNLPDTEPDPKQTIMRLVRLCNKKTLKEDMLPPEKGTAKIGPGYVNRVNEFVHHAKNPWRPDEAAVRSGSLTFCIEQLRTLNS